MSLVGLKVIEVSAVPSSMTCFYPAVLNESM
jgi:alpha-methylacyl-CoA racemase